MLRRLHHDQPERFAFTPANHAWAEAQIKKYPEGRQASAVIPLLWRAQEQEGWLSRPAIEHVADMLGMAHIRVLEVATFYFMFQLQPVGSVAHIQICGTTSCMICGAEDLVAVCKDKIAAKPHQISEDGKLSWEEVECLGACANAPMAQIGKDYFEDLTAERFAQMIDEFRAGQVPQAGPQNGRYASEPERGVTSLEVWVEARAPHNASAALAGGLGDSIRRIDGSEVPLIAPWVTKGARSEDIQQMAGLVSESSEAPGRAVTKAPPQPMAEAPVAGKRPEALSAARDGHPDDLKRIKGVGPKLEVLLHSLGFFHFDQVANWTAEEIAWVDDNLEGFKGRVSRDEWVAQAKKLAAGEDPESGDNEA